MEHQDPKKKGRFWKILKYFNPTTYFFHPIVNIIAIFATE